MYEMKVYRLGDENEYEYKYRGNYGARGEKRAARARITTEEQRRINQRNKEKGIRRLIKLNFKRNDLYVTLKYPKGQRKPIKEILKDKAAFTRTMRARYKKAGFKFKFIYRLEVGKLGGVHFHFIINAVPGEDVTGWVREAWGCGHANFEYLYEEGGFEALAAYMVKPAQSDTGQMYFEGMGMEDKKAFMRYGSSRNLERPVPEVKSYSHWTMRRILENGMPKPSGGFYIDKGSIRRGINPFTGYSYLYYTERRMDGGNKDIRMDRCGPVPGEAVQGEV